MAPHLKLLSTESQLLLECLLILTVILIPAINVDYYILLHRGFVICCNYEDLHKEIIYLKFIFQRNAYPLCFIDKCIRIFLDKLFLKKHVSYDVPKKIVSIIIPYMGSFHCYTLYGKTLSRNSYMVKKHLI